MELELETERQQRGGMFSNPGRRNEQLSADCLDAATRSLRHMSTHTTPGRRLYLSHRRRSSGLRTGHAYARGPHAQY